MGNRSRQMQVEEVGRLTFLESKQNRIQVWQTPNRTLFDLYALSASDELQLSSLIIAAQNRREFYLHCPNVIAPLKLLPFTSERGCPDSYSFEAIFEHVDKRLSDVGTLSETEIIFIMHQSLLGFGHIFKNQRAGFEVNDKMIFFNDQKKVKVWFNQRLDVNEPGLPVSLNKISDGSDSQQNLITSVVRSCQKHSSQGRFSLEFYEHLRKNQKIPLKFGDIIRNIKNYVFERHRGNQELVSLVCDSYNPHEDFALSKEGQHLLRPFKSALGQRPFVQFLTK